MERSETLVELIKAMSAFQGAMTSVPKGRENPFYSSRYADLDSIWEVCRKPLRENGLTLIQTTTEENEALYLDTTLAHISGEYITSRYPITPMRQVKNAGWELSNDPQAIGSAITYARRYAMSAILGISAEDDDDGERSMNRNAKAAPRGNTESTPESDLPQTIPCPQDGRPMQLRQTRWGPRYSHKHGEEWHNINADKIPKQAQDTAKNDQHATSGPATVVQGIDDRLQAFYGWAKEHNHTPWEAAEEAGFKSRELFEAAVRAGEVELREIASRIAAKAAPSEPDPVAATAETLEALQGVMEAGE